MQDHEPGRAIAVPGIALTFRNLRKTKTLLSCSETAMRIIDYAEVGPALPASIQAAGELELTLAGQSQKVPLKTRRIRRTLGGRFRG